MCKWNDVVEMRVPIPAELSHTGKLRWEVKLIDSCIADLVLALNARGVLTAGSCCGHGRGPGKIELHDEEPLLLSCNV